MEHNHKSIPVLIIAVGVFIMILVYNRKQYSKLMEDPSLYTIAQVEDSYIVNGSVGAYSFFIENEMITSRGTSF